VAEATYPLHVWARRPDSLDRLGETAHVRHDSITALAAECDVVALCVGTDDDLATRLDLAPPPWAESWVLRRPWFPAELQIQRAEALVWAPAAFRKHGVYLSARDLDAA
jgi:hypothetical protein